MFRDPLVREAVKAATLLAVHDCAADAARRRDAGAPWLAELQASQEAFTSQMRAWIASDGSVDDDLRRVLGSFVLRADQILVRELAGKLHRANLPSEVVDALWRRFDAAGTPEAKRAFIDADPVAAGRRPQVFPPRLGGSVPAPSIQPHPGPPPPQSTPGHSR